MKTKTISKEVHTNKRAQTVDYVEVLQAKPTVLPTPSEIAET